MTLLTIGHSTSTLGAFLRELHGADVEVLVDVRSKPRSRLSHFDSLALESAVLDEGIRYRSLGHYLGGMPQDPEVRKRWQPGRLDESVVAYLRQTEAWLEGLVELTSLLLRGGGRRVCIMCSEADPNECHRKAVALDAAALVGELDVRHLVTDGVAINGLGLQEILPR